MKRLFPVLCVFSCLISARSFAGSATWNLNPTSGDWNTAENWTPATVPNGPADVATFGVSDVPNVSLSGDTEISQIIFADSASAYSVAVNAPYTLTVTGPGLTNSSSQTQNFDLIGNSSGYSWMFFHGSSSAGSGTTITAHGGADANSKAGLLEFHNTSSAGSSTLIATEDYTYAPSGAITFFGHSTAGTATIVATGFGTSVTFSGSSTADHATISVPLAAGIIFTGHSNAGSAQITVDDLGYVSLGEDAYAGATASIVCKDGASLSVLGKNDVPVELQSSGNLYGEIDVGIGVTARESIGSLAGYGLVFITKRSTFIIGSNNLSTEFSGGIYDDQDFGGGALTKVGTGSLTLTGSNGYSQGTTVSSGLLVVANTIGSGTGSGPVTVEAGTLAGRGIISGAVTIGTGSGTGAFLAPSEGASNPATLTLESALTFKADGTYTYKLNTNKATADQVTAKRVIIESGAQFDFNVVGTKKLTAGTIFTPISNTATTIINGAFANLADGSIVTIGVNNFQVGYSGGDGNDLTLTVVP